jgi:hypothetical protein
MISSLSHDTRLQQEFGQGDDRMTAHRAIAFIVQEENVDIRIS